MYPQEKAALLKQDAQQGATRVMRRGKQSALSVKEANSCIPLTDGITIYGEDWCQYCKAATKKAAKTGKPYKYVQISKSGCEAQLAKYKHSTIPMIFIDGAFNGGSEALAIF
jgi:glutaredoxin